MQRTVIELQLAGIGDEDLARHLRISVKTVRSAACKARARLRATF
jgi:DNA-directed RNA polymerase specialized sigma24 family protein